MCIRDSVRASGLNILIKENSNAPTSLACVSLGADGQPEYQFYRTGTADRDITIEKLTAALPDNVTLFNTGSLALTDETDAAIWVSVAQTLADRGTLISIDPNVRPLFVSDWTTFKARIGGLLDLATIVKISDEDLESLDMPLDPGEAGSLLLNTHNCALAVVTYGADGAVVMNKHNSVRVPVYTPTIFGDTVGAGDTFMGGLLSDLHKRDTLSVEKLDALTADELEAIGQFAAVAAGLNCAQKGCVPPTRDEVLNTLNSQ